MHRQSGYWVHRRDRGRSLGWVEGEDCQGSSLAQAMDRGIVVRAFSSRTSSALVYARGLGRDADRWCKERGG